MSLHRVLAALTLAALTADATPLSDSLRWGNSGLNYDFVAGPLLATSQGGVTVEVSQAGPTFARRDQSDGWYGNFLPFEQLLWTYYGGPLELDFGRTPVQSLSLQIQPDLYGTYTAQLDAFGPGGALVATTQGAGVSHPLGDGSAVTLRLDTSAAVHRVRVSLAEAVDPSSFAIGSVDFSTPPATTGVPEPQSVQYVLVAIAIAIWTTRTSLPPQTRDK